MMNNMINILILIILVCYMINLRIKLENLKVNFDLLFDTFNSTLKITNNNIAELYRRTSDYKNGDDIDSGRD